jgi:hypothetical protein
MIALEPSAMCQDRTDRSSRLVGLRNDYHVGRSSATQLLGPRLRLFSVLEHAASTVNQKGSQISVASFDDAQQGHLATGPDLLWDQPKPSSKFPSCSKRLGVAHPGDCCRRCQQSYAENFENGSNSKIFLHPLTQPSLDLGNLLVQLGQPVPLLTQRIDEHRRQSISDSCQNCRNCPVQSGTAFGHHLAILGKQSVQAVDLHGAELDQLLAHAMKSKACCASVFTATALLGCWTANQIARASAASFLLRKLKAFTNCTGIIFT